MIALLLACAGTPEAPDAGAPSIGVEPGEVVLDAVVPGEVRTAEVHIHNTGDAPLSLEPVAVEGVGWALAGATPPGVAPGGSASFALTFTASDAGTFPGSAILVSDDPGRPRGSVPLTATVLGPDLALEPSSVAWGTADLGTTFSTTVSLGNVGADTLTLEGAEVLGGPEVDIGALADGPLTLEPGASTEVTIRWTPADASCVDASLVVRSDDPDSPFLVVPVTGCAELPEGARTVVVTLTGDDRWSGYLDGVELNGVAQEDWSTPDTFERVLSPGAHVLAIHGVDDLGVIAGFLGAVAVDGVTTWWTGDGAWRVSTSEEAGWEQPGFDASTWDAAVECADDSPWGGQPSSLRSMGADWIWWTADCTALGQAWFRLEFVLG